MEKLQGTRAGQNGSSVRRNGLAGQRGGQQVRPAGEGPNALRQRTRTLGCSCLNLSPETRRHPARMGV